MPLERCAIASSILTAGCVMTGGVHNVAVEDHGLPPSQVDSIVTKYYQSTLNKPESVENLYVSTPQQTWIGTAVGGPGYGYIVCTTFSARDSAGAMVTGLKDGLVIRDNIVIQRINNCDWYGKYLCRRPDQSDLCRSPE